MKSICALCGRPTRPALMIGAEAIGPKCAAKMGFTKAKAPKGSRIKFIGRHPAQPKGHEQLDLLEGIDYQ